VTEEQHGIARLGDEHDDRLLSALGSAVLLLGGKIDRSSWGVGGSQEISSWQLRFREGVVVATAETYVGLTISGPADLVTKIQIATSSVLSDPLAS